MEYSFILQGTDGVEYLLIPVDSGTLADFLEKEEEEAQTVLQVEESCTPAAAPQ